MPDVIPASIGSNDPEWLEGLPFAQPLDLLDGHGGDYSKRALNVCQDKVERRAMLVQSKFFSISGKICFRRGGCENRARQAGTSRNSIGERLRRAIGRITPNSEQPSISGKAPVGLCPPVKFVRTARNRHQPLPPSLEDHLPNHKTPEPLEFLIVRLGGNLLRDDISPSRNDG
jgi:hypothetical protein